MTRRIHPKFIWTPEKEALALRLRRGGVSALKVSRVLGTTVSALDYFYRKNRGYDFNKKRRAS
jgi:predicted transcriptional regulator